MVVDSRKATDATEVAAVEEVATAGEEVVAIQIAPTTTGTVLISEIFIWFSAVLIGMLFREMVKHMLYVNVDVQRLVADEVTIFNAGDVAMAEDNRYQKLILIGLTQVM